MLNKPTGCIGCPLYGNGVGFVPGYIPDDAILLIVGQNPSKEEERDGAPLVGAIGRMLDTVYLPLTGIDSDMVGRDNVIRCRWKNTNDLPKGKQLQEAIDHCKHLDRVPDSVRLVVAMGNIALTKFAPTLKQHTWRGHLLPQE